MPIHTEPQAPESALLWLAKLERPCKCADSPLSCVDGLSNYHCEFCRNTPFRSPDRGNPVNENAKAWVAALRSGEYQQTRRALGDVHGYCCLGVACELYIKAGNKLSRKESPLYSDRDGPYVVRYNGHSDVLPRVVQDWLGLSSPYGVYNNNNLAALNDRRISFDEIARIIESRPKGLFR